MSVSVRARQQRPWQYRVGARRAFVGLEDVSSNDPPPARPIAGGHGRRDPGGWWPDTRVARQKGKGKIMGGGEERAGTGPPGRRRYYRITKAYHPRPRRCTAAGCLHGWQPSDTGGHRARAVEGGGLVQGAAVGTPIKQISALPRRCIGSEDDAPSRITHDRLKPTRPVGKLLLSDTGN